MTVVNQKDGAVGMDLSRMNTPFSREWKMEVMGHIIDSCDQAFIGSICPVPLSPQQRPSNDLSALHPVHSSQARMIHDLDLLRAMGVRGGREGNVEQSLQGVRDRQCNSNETNMCNICMENEKCVALSPCGHTMCAGCTRQITSRRQPCPECRTPIQRVQHFRL